VVTTNSISDCCALVTSPSVLKITTHNFVHALQYFLQGNMSGYASYDDALDPKYGEPYKVKLVVANEETLKGYGKIDSSWQTTGYVVTTNSIIDCCAFVTSPLTL
jgi:hypothetical protein